jgi:hypothetical protein
MRLTKLAFSFLLFLAACNPTPAPAVTPTGGFALSGPFSMGLPNRRVRPPGPGCPPGSFDLTAQAVTGTATITLGEEGPTAELPAGLQPISVGVPDGVYTGVITSLFPDCAAGPNVGTARVTFNLVHQSIVDRQGEATVCVFRSRLDFSAFVVTGVPPLDALVENSVKDDIHQSLDSVVADRMNRFQYSGTPLPDGTSPRCNDWQQMP